MTSQPNSSASSPCFFLFFPNQSYSYAMKGDSLYLRQTTPFFCCKPRGSSPVSSESRGKSSIHTRFSSAALPSPAASSTSRHLLSCCWAPWTPSDIFSARALVSSGKSLPSILTLGPLIFWKFLLVWFCFLIYFVEVDFLFCFVLRQGLTLYPRTEAKSQKISCLSLPGAGLQSRASKLSSYLHFCSIAPPHRGLLYPPYLKPHPTLPDCWCLSLLVFSHTLIPRS